MIEHEANLGQSLCEVDGFRQLVLVDQHVVTEIEARQMGHARTKCRICQKTWRFALHDVPNTLEVLISRQLGQRARNVVRAQVHPTNDAADEAVLSRQLEQKLRLGQRLPDLHGD
jgi:hypothetical protein